MNKNLNIKKYSIYIGKTFSEMEEDVLEQMNCRVLYSSSAFSRALTDDPKIVIVNCFEEQQKNDAVVQEVINKSPNSKIIVIGRDKEEFKRTLADEIDTYLKSDVTFEGLKIAIDQLSFDHQYGEEFQNNEIELGNDSTANQIVWGVLGALIVFLMFMIYYFI